MEFTISGEIAPKAELRPAAGEGFWCSKGGLMALTPGVEWRLRVPGGVSGAVRRSLSGEGIALTWVEVRRDGEMVLLACNEPGHLAVWDLGRDGPVVTTRGSFLAAWGEEIEITVAMARRVGAAFFGGAGLFLQRVSGTGTVLVHGSGDFSEAMLGEGEELLVSSGHLAAFAGGVDYDIKGIGGCRRVLFGGEGLFMTRLRGPGRVLLQTLKRRSAARATPAG
jgi:uncharacterized protein (AIM24 family)